jgi:hypothetical protein
MAARTAEQKREHRNQRQREIRAAKAAGTHVPRVWDSWRSAPDMSQLKPRADIAIPLPLGSPRLIPVVSAATAGRAPCTSMDPQLFESSTPEAKTACKECGIRTECASAAKSSGERYMVWGGVDFHADAEAEAC